MQSIKIDFGEGGGEREVFFKKRNLDQLDAVLQAEKTGQVEVLVVTLVTRALTEHGSLMFGKSDMKDIRKRFDPNAVIKFSKAVREFDAEVEKPGN